MVDSGQNVDLWRLDSNNFQGWEYGKVFIESEARYRVSSNNCNTSKIQIKQSLLQILAKVVKAKEANGWAGLDDFMFYVDQEDCPIEPQGAQPSTPAPTTTTPMPPGKMKMS